MLLLGESGWIDIVQTEECGQKGVWFWLKGLDLMGFIRRVVVHNLGGVVFFMRRYLFSFLYEKCNI